MHKAKFHNIDKGDFEDRVSVSYDEHDFDARLPMKNKPLVMDLLEEHPKSFLELFFVNLLINNHYILTILNSVQQRTSREKAMDATWSSNDGE